MNLIVDGRVLRDSSLEDLGLLSFTNQLNRHPAMAIHLIVGARGRNGARPDLAHDSEELAVPDGNLHEAADLADAVALPLDKGQTGRLVQAQRHTDGCPADVLDRADGGCDRGIRHRRPPRFRRR